MTTHPWAVSVLAAAKGLAGAHDLGRGPQGAFRKQHAEEKKPPSEAKIDLFSAAPCWGVIDSQVLYPFSYLLSVGDGFLTRLILT